MSQVVSVPKGYLMRPVIIRWLDHIGHGPHWTDIADIDDKPAVYNTVGFLLKIKKDRLVIGSTLSLDKEETGDVTVLIRSCVLTVNLLVTP